MRTPPADTKQAKLFADAEAQIPQVLKATGEMQAHTATLTEDVAQHNKDQEAAKAAMAVARRRVRRRLPPSRTKFCKTAN